MFKYGLTKSNMKGRQSKPALPTAIRKPFAVELQKRLRERMSEAEL